MARLSRNQESLNIVKSAKRNILGGFMRFFADGPNIPDELLQERDDGNVVFFCGAGVSRPAGLPGFLDLAEQVVEELGAPEDAKVRQMLDRAKQEPDGLISLDHVFGLLKQDYQSTNIDDIVSRLLKIPTAANLDQHSTILRLSTNAAGQTQVVTTNFDLLFERARKGIQKHVAPSLPDLSSGQPLTGLVYLHGRLSSPENTSRRGHQLILSNSDFGRAYLADGWATRFVRDLLKNYVIVLLGYSANDPPIRYLLEGLHSRNDVNAMKIFAFDQGGDDEVAHRWQNRGVVPLAYGKTKDHSTLWNSLQAWATRADDPDEWRRMVLLRATVDPKTLTPHERGQVVSLARTTEGAKLFANSAAVPPAEWICVFDKLVRNGEPRESARDQGRIDPAALYGLDDDPPRTKDANNPNAHPGIDVLSVSPSDERLAQYSRLAGGDRRGAPPISPRLFYIVRWFRKVLDQPAAPWWLAGYNSVHQTLVEQIEWQLSDSDAQFDTGNRQIWDLLLQRLSSAPFPQDNQYHVRAKIKKHGWSLRTHYEFEAAIQPFLKVRRPLSASTAPPTRQHGTISASEIVHFEVEFPAQGLHELEIPAEHLYRCFRSVRRGLERGAELLDAIQTRHWHTANFDEDYRPGTRHLRAPDLYLHWAKRLFTELSIQNPDLARSDFNRWPANEIYFFDKLRIYVLMNVSLFAGNEVAECLLDLSDEGFWDGYHRRELLHTLRARWSEIHCEDRKKLEDRIVKGKATANRGIDADEARRHRNSEAASILGWLQANDCELSNPTVKLLPKLQSANPEWNAHWAASADESLDARAGYVAVRTDPTRIIDAPIPQIIEVANQHSTRPFMEFTEYRPFSGLVMQHPQRALAALAYQGRQGNFPTEYWRTALDEWPAELPQRLQRLFAHRVTRLPKDLIVALRFSVTRWMEKHLPSMAREFPVEALGIWDIVVGGLCAGGEEASQSGLGEVSVGGKSINRSRRTYDHAINSPIGAMADALFRILDDRKLTANSGIPNDIRPRLERLFTSPGEGADHAICQTTIRLGWLFYLDPNWVALKLVPTFSIEDKLAEPAWNGYLHSSQLSVSELFSLLKPHFLRVFEIVTDWQWDNQPISQLSEFLVIACYWNLRTGRYVSYAEARRMLQRLSDEGRSHAIWLLGSIVRDRRAWKAFGRPFIERAWPRETRLQTESSSRQFAAIAEDSGNNFPDVVRTICPLLVPSSQLDLFVYKTGEKEGDHQESAADLPRKFPAAMLVLLDRLVPDDPNLAPFDLGSLVNTIAVSDPGLRQDPRWRRLNRIVHSR